MRCPCTSIILVHLELCGPSCCTEFLSKPESREGRCCDTEVKCKAGDGKCLRPPGLDNLEDSRDSWCKQTVLGKKMDCKNWMQQSLEITQKPRNGSKQYHSHENYPYFFSVVWDIHTDVICCIRPLNEQREHPSLTSCLWTVLCTTATSQELFGKKLDEVRGTTLPAKCEAWQWFKYPRSWGFRQQK